MAGGKVAGTWPRSSTLKKNRFHEKHLATHGALGWHYATGDALIEAFDAYAIVEEKSWIADHDDGGRDAKFTANGHGAFWRAAAADPVQIGRAHVELQYLMRISYAAFCLKKKNISNK